MAIWYGMITLKQIMFLILSFTIGQFTLILKVITQGWFCWTRISHVAFGPERENKYCADILLTFLILFRYFCTNIANIV